MRRGRLLTLILLDSADSLRPPGFDVMMLVIAALGAVIATIQPVTKSYVLARLVLEPTLFTVALYLGLRGASGLASLVSYGVVEVYMSYPVSRRTVILGILTSRVVVPALTLLFIPLLVAGIIVYPVVLDGPAQYLIVYGGYVVQALLYGTAFLLIALASKSSGTASVLSITFYFAYGVVWLLMQTLAPSLGDWALHLSIAMMFYRVAYFTALSYEGLSTIRLTTMDYLFVPVLLLSLLATLLYYFERRFEPA
ncbi:MAG: hypothetical protein GSR73_00295 [Desulfurococcales archaeon]|nr:hypothetical protein [Desulfurococcales archaeon]